MRADTGHGSLQKPNVFLHLSVSGELGQVDIEVAGLVHPLTCEMWEQVKHHR